MNETGASKLSEEQIEARLSELILPALGAVLREDDTLLGRVSAQEQQALAVAAVKAIAPTVAAMQARDEVVRDVAAFDPCMGGDERHDRHLAVCVPFYEWRDAILTRHTHTAAAGTPSVAD